MSETSTTTTTVQRDPADQGFTSAGIPVTYVGDDATIRTYRADDGDLVIQILDYKSAVAGTIRLTSDNCEAKFLTALAQVTS